MNASLRAAPRSGLAGAVVVCALLATVSACAPAASRTRAQVAPVVTVAPSAPSVAPPTPAEHGSRPKPATPKLRAGMTGPAVSRLQRRLTALGYWLGPVNGTFDDATVQAVYAIQKVAGIAKDGVVGPKTWRAVRDGVLPVPVRLQGTGVEVDLSRDLLMFVRNGVLRYVINTSTGGGYTYYEYGAAATAETPIGHFHIYRAVDGLVVDPLGELWRPRYFSGGYAIHGDGSVPPYPASHGCVRVSNEAIDWIWAQDLLPIGTSVWIGR